ncbi:MAG: hypothetical protein MZV64_34165 [Ignavibacteriales bacterium]|nr:hypothetical protein [Ignavibacteriales bacterium]
MFLGGWYSFTGELGKGGWGRTRARARSCPSAASTTRTSSRAPRASTPSSRRPASASSKAVNFRTMPPILGYNKTTPSPRAGSCSRSGTSGDPAAGRPDLRPRPGPGLHVRPRPRTGASTSSSGRTTPRFWLECVGRTSSREAS